MQFKKVMATTMEGFERDLCERNDDDWYVPDCSLEYIAVTEYRIYERECAEEYENAD